MSVSEFLVLLWAKIDEGNWFCYLQVGAYLSCEHVRLGAKHTKQNVRAVSRCVSDYVRCQCVAAAGKSLRFSAVNIDLYVKGNECRRLKKSKKIFLHRPVGICWTPLTVSLRKTTPKQLLPSKVVLILFRPLDGHYEVGNRGTRITEKLSSLPFFTCSWVDQLLHTSSAFLRRVYQCLTGTQTILFVHTFRSSHRMSLAVACG